LIATGSLRATWHFTFCICNLFFPKIKTCISALQKKERVVVCHCLTFLSKLSQKLTSANKYVRNEEPFLIAAFKALVFSSFIPCCFCCHLFLRKILRKQKIDSKANFSVKSTKLGQNFELKVWHLSFALFSQHFPPSNLTSIVKRGLWCFEGKI